MWERRALKFKKSYPSFRLLLWWPLLPLVHHADHPVLLFATTWRQSCKLLTSPCPLTRSDQLHHRPPDHRRIEANSDINLPFQTLGDNAEFSEYTQEVQGGKILKRTITRATGQEVDWKLVTFEINDPENPKNWSKAYKWYCTMLIALVCFVVAFASSVITADVEGPAKDLGMSTEVSLLAITLFVIGFGIGPMVFA